MEKSFLKKIDLINRASLNSLTDESNLSITKNFTEKSIKILNSDFGFAWGKFNDENNYHLIYQSLNTPYSPTIPKKKKGQELSKQGYVLYDSNVKKENYGGDMGRYLKSYLMIPIRYGDHVYGSIVLCYRKAHKFTEEELALAGTIGTIVAQAVTINWLIEKEKKSLVLAEKQKEIEVLLSQEKLKMEFLANATHELRTPLAIMKGNVDLALLEKEDPKKAVSALKAIGDEINLLSEILKDLSLLTSSPQNLKNIIHFIPVNLPNLLEKIVSRVKTIAKEKNISIAILSKDKNLSVSGDERYLEKLFLNLIKNAITYGHEQGYIKIKISKNKNNRKNQVQVEIADNGIGISKEDLPKIFDRFYQVDKSHAGQHSGLGLAIAKWVAEIHEGEIKVKSNLGKGSTFTVSLPTLKHGTEV